MRRPAALLVLVAFIVASCTGNELTSDTQPSAASHRERSTTTTEPSGKRPTSTGPSTTESADSGFPSNWKPQPIEWKDCPGEPNFQCGSLTVPLDWSEPTGKTIDLAVARKQATGKRIGSLLSNPGGPGASGLDFLFGDPFGDQLHERFDLVSWDPRGVGKSAGLTCGSKVPAFLHLDPDPDSTDEQSAIDAAAKAVADECAPEADVLKHIGTDDTARDLEALRIALGDDKLTYLGFSYGTFIGERYLALFPSHARAVVLDGVVNPNDGLTNLLTGQTTAMTSAIGRAFATCATTTACRLGDAKAAYDKVKQSVEATPLPAKGNRPLGPAELSTGAIFATYEPAAWPELLDAVEAARSGDGEPMSALADFYYDFGDWTAYAAITCTDSAHPVGADAYKSFVDGLRQQSPDFGGAIGNEMLPCAYWPVEAKALTGPITAEASPDILVVGNTGDAATPYDDAQAVADMLAHGHLLTYKGEGHTAYGRDPCIDQAIHDYLIELKIPNENAACGSSSAGDVL